MKKKIILLLCTFLTLFSLIFLMISNHVSTRTYDTSELILSVNAYGKKLEDERLSSEDTHLLQNELRNFQHQNSDSFDFTPFWLLYCFSISFFIGLFGFVYYRILKPFEKLQRFATEVSRGNFDFPLQEQRNQSFGAFSWAFDNMRFELKKAKENEQLALQNSKTVIASLSHDIKTPIASIRACSEALHNGMDTTSERRKRYLDTIIKKCDAVCALTNDLFLHSLADMEALQYHCEWVEITSFLEVLHTTLLLEYEGRIQIDDQVLRNKDKSFFFIDEKRYVQVIANICQNAMKYTNGHLFVSYQFVDQTLLCCLQDEGNGILDEDLPFIFEKFYRGKHVEKIAGAGLGLYLVQDMMQKMQGSVTIANAHPGVCVTLQFLTASASLKIS